MVNIAYYLTHCEYICFNYLYSILLKENVSQLLFPDDYYNNTPVKMILFFYSNIHIFYYKYITYAID